MTIPRNSIPRNVLLVCLVPAMLLATTGLACGDNYSDEHCDDIVDQIRTALEENVNNGVLVREAVACGDEGVANRTDSFNARVPPADVEYLQAEFRKACSEYLDHC